MTEITRRHIRTPGVQGMLFLPDGGGPHPGALVLPGSGSGIREEVAAALARHGLACLSLLYFGAPGLPRQIAEIPLETVETAAGWLADQPETADGPAGVIGASKGAELALLAAAAFPGSIGPAVGVAPAAVAFFGLDPYADDPAARERSSWSLRGHPVPFVPYPEGAEPEETEAGLAVAPVYEAALRDEDAVAEAAIPVERAAGPVLLLSGGDDRVWPSAPMGERLAQRARLGDTPAEITHVVYPDAGHDLFDAPAPGPGVELPEGGPTLDAGGTPEADERARRDGWRKAGEFLREHLPAS